MAPGKTPFPLGRKQHINSSTCTRVPGYPGAEAPAGLPLAAAENNFVGGSRPGNTDQNFKLKWQNTGIVTVTVNVDKRRRLSQCSNLLQAQALVHVKPARLSTPRPTLDFEPRATQ
eukprot:1020475-Rhodomonas_salina.1